MSSTAICAMCENTINTKRCERCKSIWYCSPACQTSDWPSHKLLCKAMAESSDSPPSGSKADFTRGIIFPDDNPVPKLVWLRLARVQEPGKEIRKVDLDNLQIISPDYLSLQQNVHRSRPLEDTIHIAYQRNPSSKMNQCVTKLTNGASTGKWSGPIVAYKTTGTDSQTPSSYKLMTLHDFRDVIDYLATSEYSNVIGNSFGPLPDTIRAVRVSCHDMGKYSAVPITAKHPIFTDGTPSPISYLLSLPLKMYKIPPAPPQGYVNQPATFLLMDINPRSPGWGWAPRAWSTDISDILIVREDKKDISPVQIEVLLAFVEGPVRDNFGDSLGENAPQPPMSKSDVLAGITRAKFEDFFKKYIKEMESNGFDQKGRYTDLTLPY